MASGFFALLDDIATLMDDLASVSKVAAKNTAGVLGDDLAVNAAKASTFSSSRELPVIWAITKGSLVNKIIIVPLMLLLSYYFPQAITPILILGGRTGSGKTRVLKQLDNSIDLEGLANHRGSAFGPTATPQPCAVSTMALQMLRNCDFCPIQSLKPTGLPPDNSRNCATNSSRPTGEEKAVCPEGETTSCPMGTPRMAAISSVSLAAGKIPP